MLNSVFLRNKHSEKSKTGMNIIIANSTQLHQTLESKLVQTYNVTIIKKKEGLSQEILEKLSPDFIFFIHWAYKIPKEIHEKYACVVFHMTDLPFGRGGSPLQNLIVRGFSQTKISAIKVVDDLDAGDIYFKKDLSLWGTADEIFLRADTLIETMIKEIIEKKPIPIPQEGTVTTFVRRTPRESDIRALTSLEQVYDFIRMLDGEGYPHAFVETETLRFEFSRASIKSNEIIADVRITKK